MTDLRLLSWNVRSLRQGRSEVAAVIRAADVDVALVQEAPRLLRWRSKRAALARESRLLVGTADRLGGLFVMTSPRTWVLEHAHLPLAATPRRHRRALVSATVSVAGAPAWALAVTHLGLDAEERARHAGVVRSVAEDQPDLPLVLAGDLNAEPGSRVWDEMAAGLQDTFAGHPTATFPSAGPRRRIDAVFASPSVSVKEARVVDTPDARAASDHLPLVVVLEDAR